jgi:hypothetical protein
VKSERSRSTLLAHIVVLAYEQPNKAEGMMDHHFKYRVRVALCSTIYISYDLPELMKFFGNCTFEKWTQHLVVQKVLRVNVGEMDVIWTSASYSFPGFLV